MTSVGSVLGRLTGQQRRHTEAARSDFESRIERYAADATPAEGDGQALTEAFLASAGSWLTDANHRLSDAEPRYDFSGTPDLLGLWNEPGSFDRTLSDLCRDGYAILDTRLPADMVTQLADYFAAAPCTLTSDVPTTTDTPTVSVDFDAPLAEKYAITLDATIQSPLVRSLLLDRGLLQIAQAYLGAVPIIDIIIAWFSFPRTYASHQAGQLYHFDLDRLRWLKVFFLLSDQDTETGAHMFVPGTQRDGGIDPKLLARGYARLEDDDVARYHPRSSWKTMEGQSGVILLEDTRGLHKGMQLKRDHRLMLQFEYTSSLFGSRPQLSDEAVSPIDDAEWAAARAAYPRVFAALPET